MYFSILSYNLIIIFLHTLIAHGQQLLSFTSISDFNSIKILYEENGGSQWMWDNNTGRKWVFSSNLDQQEDPCKMHWQGISCSNSTSPIFLRIDKLNLTSLGLTGSLSTSAVKNLTALKELDLGNNSLTGAIPKELENLSLTRLDMSYNKLTGSIPDFIAGNLSCITSVRLNNNKLTGPLPDFFAMNLSFLANLNIANNKLSGTIPVNTFKRLPQLEYVDIGYNAFRGQLPEFNSPNLTFLALADNKFTGTVPSLERLSALTFLTLFNNDLTGEVLPNIIKLQQIEFVDIGRNAFRGHLPVFNSSNLTFLSLADNKFTGTVPSLERLSALTFLSMNRNSLAGEIPSSIGSSILTQCRHRLTLY